jgi:uncharacterized Zn finger protein
LRAEESERTRLAKLDALAANESQVWLQVEQLLAKRSASGYDEAVIHLAELRDLASHRGQLAAFAARRESRTAPYVAPAALQRLL